MESKGCRSLVFVGCWGTVLCLACIAYLLEGLEPSWRVSEHSYDYPNGQLQAQGFLRRYAGFLTDYTHIHAHGDWRFYDPEGHALFGGSFDTGQRVGTWEGWYPDGQVGYRGEFERGVPSGEWNWWFPDGVLATRGSFSSPPAGFPSSASGGVPTGLWSFWYGNGQLAARGEFAATWGTSRVLRTGAPATLDGYLDLEALPRMWDGQATGRWTFLDREGEPLPALGGTYACGWKIDDSKPVSTTYGDVLTLHATDHLWDMLARSLTGFVTEEHGGVLTSLSAVEYARKLELVGKSGERIPLEVVARDVRRGVALLSAGRRLEEHLWSRGNEPGAAAVLPEQPVPPPAGNELLEEGWPAWQPFQPGMPAFSNRVSTTPGAKVRLAPGGPQDSYPGAPICDPTGGVSEIVIDAVHCPSSGGDLLLTVPLDQVQLEPWGPPPGLGEHPSLETGIRLPLFMVYSGAVQELRMELRRPYGGDLVGEIYGDRRQRGPVLGAVQDHGFEVSFEPKRASPPAFEAWFAEERLDSSGRDAPLWYGLPPETILYRAYTQVDRIGDNVVEAYLPLLPPDSHLIAQLLARRSARRMLRASFQGWPILNAVPMEGQTVDLPSLQEGEVWRLRGIVGISESNTGDRWEYYPDAFIQAWIDLDGSSVPELVWSFSRDDLEPRCFDVILPAGTSNLKLMTNWESLPVYLVNGNIQRVP